MRYRSRKQNAEELATPREEVAKEHGCDDFFGGGCVLDVGGEGRFPVALPFVQNCMGK